MNAVLFDLDGTLLSLNQDEFINEYFNLLANKMSNYGYNKNELIKAVWHGTKAMVNNNGTKTNEEAFWNDFKNIYGDKVIKDINIFNNFYTNDFNELSKYCSKNDDAIDLVKYLKQNNYRVLLLTNPIFPKVATISRMRWAGFAEDDFEIYTTYENIGFAKPNINYYTHILDKTKLNPNECLMVGNDVDEDMIVKSIGVDVFLITDNLVNRQNIDISQFNNGSFLDLKKYILSKEKL